MVQTGSDLGESPSSNNESEQKAEKEKEKLISVQEGVMMLNFLLFKMMILLLKLLEEKLKK